MAIKGIVKKGEYFDSVSLMIVAHKINGLEGVMDSAVFMGTRENKSIMDASGFLVPVFHEAGDADLLIAIKAGTESAATAALGAIDEELKRLRKKDRAAGPASPRSIDKALEILPGANLAIISVAGKYASNEALKALEKGLHVMLFSDNVPLEKEIFLKKYALERNLLVMGPDCGTAIINGVPLAFANVVKRGNIGVVGASGTGTQEVTSLISNWGGGISQAIGTGGRDVKKEVGGIMFISALKALGEDPCTDAILLVSKPPHPDTLQKIGEHVKQIKKPVAAVFLGADPALLTPFGMIPAPDLESGVLKILELAGIKPDFSDEFFRLENIDSVAEEIKKKLRPEQKYLRALFSGGTFCGETQVILSGINDVFSNAPVSGSLPLHDVSKSEKHTVIDLGADEFTVGKPHPMIDFSTRNKRILQEASDKETAVILLDLVLGFGANPNPLPELLPVIAEGEGKIPIICSVTGTDQDPQNRSAVVEALEKAGVIVCRSNAQASYLCKKIIHLFVKRGLRPAVDPKTFY